LIAIYMGGVSQFCHSSLNLIIRVVVR